MSTFFDSRSLWEIFAATAFLTFLSIELGFRLGQRRRSHPKLESSIGAMSGATAGLLAFMLAVTFGAAITRHDTRKELVLREANAIGTTYLRAGLLNEPGRHLTQTLLREYVDVRVSAAQGVIPMASGLLQSEALQKKLWDQALNAGRANPERITIGLFIESLNEVIDLHLERLTSGIRNRLPWTSWVTLYLLAVATMVLMGYSTGIGSERNHLSSLTLVFAFTMVLFVIADLDRPQQGLIRVSQQAMLDLQQSMKNDQ